MCIRAEVVSSLVLCFSRVSKIRPVHLPTPSYSTRPERGMLSPRWHPPASPRLTPQASQQRLGVVQHRTSRNIFMWGRDRKGGAELPPNEITILLRPHPAVGEGGAEAAQPLLFDLRTSSKVPPPSTTNAPPSLRTSSGKYSSRTREGGSSTLQGRQRQTSDGAVFAHRQGYVYWYRGAHARVEPYDALGSASKTRVVRLPDSGTRTGGLRIKTNRRRHDGGHGSGE